jgi:hypothetical protein
MLILVVGAGAIGGSGNVASNVIRPRSESQPNERRANAE